MNAPAPATQRSSLKDRLESALNSGASPEALMSEIAAACSASSNAAWEALALIDQYYRRHRLTQDVYRALKRQTEQLALGRAMYAEPGAKAAPRAEPPPGSATARAPAPAPGAQRPARSGHSMDVPPVAARAPGPMVQRPARTDLAADASGERTGEQRIVAERRSERTGEQRILGDRSLDERALPPEPVDDARSATGTFNTTPRSGQLLRGRYRLEARLDYGGGVVFQALDEFRKELPEEEQRVAIRFPDDALEAQREFYRAQHLSHPNIARLIEFDRDGELFFYTMELLHGRLLRDVLKQATHLPLPQPEALGIIRDVAAALQHAHARNVVHGYLDTGSVLIGQNGSVLVLNFGLPRTDGSLPEPRDDLTALCLITYELLAGYRPYDGRSLQEARERRVKLRRPSGLQSAQWRALQRGLAATDKTRTLTIDEWLRDLDSKGQAPDKPITPEVLIQAQPPPRWRRPLLLVGSLLAVALAVAIPAYKFWLSGPAAGDRAISAPAPSSGPVTPDASDVAPTAPATAASATGPAAGAEPRAGTAATLVTPPSSSASTVTPAPSVVQRVPAPVAAPSPALPPASAASLPSAADRGAAAAGDAAAPADNGAGVLAFQAESFTVAPGEVAARIPVRRIGGARGDVGVAWSTEDGSAHAGEDFVSFGTQRETIPGGQRAVTLFIPLSADTPREVQSDFYVRLSDPAGGAKLGRITRLKVIIAPSRN